MRDLQNSIKYLSLTQSCVALNRQDEELRVELPVLPASGPLIGRDDGFAKNGGIIALLRSSSLCRSLRGKVYL